MRCASGADVSATERLSPRLNLRRSTRAGAWNVNDLPQVSEVRDERTGQTNCHLPQLFAELSHCSDSLRSQETWERVGQWGCVHLLQPFSGTS